jgi:YggT family protein
MSLILLLLIQLLNIYFWIIILSVVVSWLVVFNVLNPRNKWVYKFCILLDKITNPVILRLRRVIPPVGGIDLTPMVVIFGIYFLQKILLAIYSAL